jgi:hypothetical protein
MIRRFRQLIFTYLKGVRSRIDLRDTLSRPAESGGLGLSPSQADKVIKLAAFISVPSAFASSATAFKPASPVQKIIDSEASKALAQAAADTSYDLKAAIMARQKEASKNVQPVQGQGVPVSIKRPETPVSEAVKTKLIEPQKSQDKPLLEESLSPVPMVIAKPVTAIAPKPAMKPEIRRDKAPVLAKPIVNEEKKTVAIKPDVSKIEEKKQEVPKPISPAGLREPGSNRRIQDIKPAPRVMSPIDELKLMSVLNFRRLGDSPQARTEKIVSKIKLLERDGYDKMVQGVKAWRVSPANRLYLQIAKDALVAGMKIKDAAEARGKQGKETYSLEEIEAVIGLNNKLMF